MISVYHFVFKVPKGTGGDVEDGEIHKASTS